MKVEERVAAALERIAAALELQNDLLGQAGAAEPVCPHPEDAREDHSTMGHPRWRCKACGYSEGM